MLVEINNVDTGESYIVARLEDCRDDVDRSVYKSVVRHKDVITQGCIVGVPMEDYFKPVHESKMTLGDIAKSFAGADGKCLHCLNPLGLCQRLTANGWYYCPIYAITLQGRSSADAQGR